MSKKLRAYEKIKPFVLDHLDNNCLEIDEENFTAWLNPQCSTWIHESLNNNNIQCSVGSVRKAVKELLEEGKLVRDSRHHHSSNVLFVHSKVGVEKKRQAALEMAEKRAVFLNDSQPLIQEGVLRVLKNKLTVDEENLSVHLEPVSNNQIYWDLQSDPSLKRVFRVLDRHYSDIDRAIRLLVKEGVLVELVREGWNNNTYCCVETRQKMFKIHNDFELRRQGKKLAATKSGNKLERLLARHGVIANQTDHEITISQTQYDNLLSLLARVA